jgi:precorrin-6y C5,15-methyltransferase (decarboxylating) CbiE subunit
VSGQDLTPHGITIVGCGPGGLEYLTPAARCAIEEAEVLVGARRVLEGLPPTTAERIVVGADIPGALEALAGRVGRQRIAVVVSGDPGVCSLAQPVIRRFGRAACRVIPGITAVQVAFARLGLEWFGATLLSAHEGVPAVTGAALADAPKIAVLAGNPASVPWLRSLGRDLAGSHAIFVCENLTLPDERVRRVSGEELAGLPLPARTVLLFVRPEALA